MSNHNFKTTATIDFPNCLIDSAFGPSYWFTIIIIPVTVKVSDSDGDWDSFLCNVEEDDELEIVFSENHSQIMKIHEFCKSGNISFWKLGSLCMTENIRQEAQHRFIYG